jgi:hypothetical protein
MGAMQKGINKKYSRQKQRVSATDCSQPKGVKPKIRKRKLRSDVNWQGTINQKGVKQGLGV